MPWTRPAHLQPGQTWSRFQVSERDGRPAQRFQVQDLDEGDGDRCIDFLTDVFLRDEPLCQALGILSDADSVSTIRANWRSFLTQGVTLACYDEGRELAGAAICLVCSCDDEEPGDFDQIRGEPWKKLLKTLIAADEVYNIFKRHSVDQFFSIHVMAVSPVQRGMGVGVELLRASEALAKALDLKLVSAVLTAVESQCLAAKCGYTLFAELPYSQMLQQGIDLSSCSTKSALVMGKEL